MLAEVAYASGAGHNPGRGHNRNVGHFGLCPKPALEAVLRLVERFERDRDVFPAGSHKEEQLRRTKTPHERESLERTIAATDRKGETLRFAQGDPVGRIDALVYELYGLTKEEIRIVEKRGDE